MQPLSMKVLAPYAQLVLGDSTSAVPDPVPGVLVSRNRSCVVIGCVPDVDGETDLAVGAIGWLVTDDPLVFDGMVDLPTRTFTICTADNQELYRFPRAVDLIQLRVWANHPATPNRVAVGLLEK